MSDVGVRNDVLDLIRRVCEVAADAAELPAGTADRVQSNCLTQWISLAHHFLSDLGGEPWMIEPLRLRDGDTVTRWEHGTDGVQVSDES